MMVIIEGGIGSGKSTLAKQLNKIIPNSKLFEEPVETNPYLEDFYKDPKRWGLEMQFWLFTRRYKMHKEAIKHTWKTARTCIFDRSLYGDTVFEKNLYRSGDITYSGHMNYVSFRDTILKSEGQLHPHKMVFLQVDPEECHKRIMDLRKRGYESDISIEYLRGLDDLYHELIRELQEYGTDVIELDWNKWGDPQDVLDKLDLGTAWEGWKK